MNTPQRAPKAAIQQIREHFNITDVQLRPLSELYERLTRRGIRAEDDEFSRAIIEEQVPRKC